MFLAVSAAVASTPTTLLEVPNMNGAYLVSKTAGAPADKGFPTNFKDYPGTIAEQATQWQANSPTLRST